MSDESEGEGAPQLYESVETGTRLSVYDLAIGARHAQLDKNPDEGPEKAVRFDGNLYVPVDEADH
jgi:hypothetical protein